MQTVSNLQSLNINPNKGLLTAGESAGADIALAIAHLWTEAKASPPITGIYSCANSAVNKETVPLKYKENFVSFEQNAGAPMQTIEAYECIQSKAATVIVLPRAHSTLPYLANNNVTKKTTSQIRGAILPSRSRSQTHPLCRRRTSRLVGGISCVTVHWSWSRFGKMPRYRHG